MSAQYKDLGKVCLTSEGNWSNTQTYEILSLVYDATNNASYISKQDVPAGISLSNTDYWQLIIKGQTDVKIVVDSILNTQSSNPVENKVIAKKLSEIESKIAGIEPCECVVDSALSSTSKNPLENKAIYSLLQSIYSRLEKLEQGTTEDDNKVATYTVTANKTECENGETVTLNWVLYNANGDVITAPVSFDLKYSVGNGTAVAQSFTDSEVRTTTFAPENDGDSANEWTFFIHPAAGGVNGTSAKVTVHSLSIKCEPVTYTDIAAGEYLTLKYYIYRDGVSINTTTTPNIEAFKSVIQYKDANATAWTSGTLAGADGAINTIQYFTTDKTFRLATIYTGKSKIVYSSEYTATWAKEVEPTTATIYYGRSQADPTADNYTSFNAKEMELSAMNDTYDFADAGTITEDYCFFYLIVPKTMYISSDVQVVLNSPLEDMWETATEIEGTDYKFYRSLQRQNGGSEIKVNYNNSSDNATYVRDREFTVTATGTTSGSNNTLEWTIQSEEAVVLTSGNPLNDLITQRVGVGEDSSEYTIIPASYRSMNVNVSATNNVAHVQIMYRNNTFTAKYVFNNLATLANTLEFTNLTTEDNE